MSGSKFRPYQALNSQRRLLTRMAEVDAAVREGLKIMNIYIRIACRVIDSCSHFVTDYQLSRPIYSAILDAWRDQHR